MNLTSCVLIAVATGLVFWDIYAQFRWGYTGTISYDMLSAAYEHPVIPFGFGVIMGHLFWPQ